MPPHTSRSSERLNGEDCIELLPRQQSVMPVQVGRDVERAEGAEIEAVVVKPHRHIKTGAWATVYWVIMMALDLIVLINVGGRAVAACIALQLVVGSVLLFLRFRSVLRRPALEEPPPPPCEPDTLLEELMGHREWRYIPRKPEDIRTWFHLLVPGRYYRDQRPRRTQRRVISQRSVS